MMKPVGEIQEMKGRTGEDRLNALAVSSSCTDSGIVGTASAAA